MPLIALMEQSVRTLLRDQDPGAYAKEPEEIRDAILRKALEFGCGMLADEVTDVTLAINPGNSSAPFDSEDMRVDSILMVWRDDGLELKRIPMDDILILNAQNNNRGRPEWYALKRQQSFLFIYVSPAPLVTESLHIRKRITLSAPNLEDTFDVPVSDLMEQAINTAVAAEMYAGLPDTERMRLKLNPDAAKAWLASSAVLLGKEKDRASRLTRVSHITAGVP